jgi:hypothetical protein
MTFSKSYFQKQNGFDFIRKIKSVWNLMHNQDGLENRFVRIMKRCRSLYILLKYQYPVNRDRVLRLH